jgi:CRP/FNR family transcriptional regulator
LATRQRQSVFHETICATILRCNTGPDFANPAELPARETGITMSTLATDFLGQLAASERETLLKLARRKRLRKGELVFRVGDVKRGAYLLLSGRLKFFRLAPSGREVILWFCFPGEVFGMSEVPAAKGRRVNVQACEDSEVAVVADAAFNRYLDCHPNAGRLCRRTMAARLGTLTNTLVNLIADDADARVAKLILHLGLQHGTRHGDGITLETPYTHQEIANMSGVNRQTVTRLLGDMRSKGILSFTRRRICIESEAMLKELMHRGAD